MSNSAQQTRSARRPALGAIAAGHAQTAAAAAAALEAGGNAFDAAVAGVLTACVAESVLTSLGGGGFLLAHTVAGTNTLYDFFSQTPGQRRSPQDIDFYPIEANFGDTTQTFHVGLGSMAVPGVWAGLRHVHQQLGRLPLAAVAHRAISAARQGVVVNRFMAYVYQILAPILLATPATRATYAPKGELLKAGDRLYMSEFADTLEHLLSAPNDLYCGTLADQLSRDCAAGGGCLSAADLQRYQVIERQPLSIGYRGRTLLTNPPPSSGGALIAFSLALLSAVDLTQTVPGSSQHTAWLTQVMELTNTARRDGYDAALHQPGIAAQFLTPAHTNAYQQKLQAGPNRLGSTTHLSVIDSEGNAASVTTSNGEGSAYVIPGTGIMVNNMLGEEDLSPQGFHQWQPHQRISSMMAPTIILRQGQPEIVLGSGGSNRIRTAILQVISNLVDFDLSLADAVTAPRLHWEAGTLHLEPPADSAVDRANVGNTYLSPTQQIVRWPQQNMFFGGVHAVQAAAAGWDAVGDPRRSGVGLLV